MDIFVPTCPQVEPQVGGTPRWFQWRSSTCTWQETSMPSRLPTISWLPRLTPECSTRLHSQIRFVGKRWCSREWFETCFNCIISVMEIYSISSHNRLSSIGLYPPRKASVNFQRFKLKDSKNLVFKNVTPMIWPRRKSRDSLGLILIQRP